MRHRIELLARESFADILEIVNDAARAYRGVIPADRWHEPYMPAEELRAEMAALAAEQRNDTTTAAEYRARLAELRRIARTHGAERLERIEN